MWSLKINALISICITQFFLKITFALYIYHIPCVAGNFTNIHKTNIFVDALVTPDLEQQYVNQSVIRFGDRTSVRSKKRAK